MQLEEVRMQFAGQTLTKESRFPRVYDIYFFK